MQDDVCWCSFFPWFRDGGQSSSNFLASTVLEAASVGCGGYAEAGPSQERDWCNSPDHTNENQVSDLGEAPVLLKSGL